MVFKFGGSVIRSALRREAVSNKRKTTLNCHSKRGVRRGSAQHVIATRMQLETAGVHKLTSGNERGRLGRGAAARIDNRHGHWARACNNRRIHG